MIRKQIDSQIELHESLGLVPQRIESSEPFLSKFMDDLKEVVKFDDSFIEVSITKYRNIPIEEKYINTVSENLTRHWFLVVSERKQ